MLEALKNGEEEAYRKIYTMYRDPFVHWVGRKYRIERGDAETIFHLAVVVLHDKVSSGKISRLRSSVKTFLFGIGKNVAREFLRGGTKLLADPSPILLQYATETAGVDDKLKLEKDILQMYKALEILGNPCKKLIEHFYYDGLTMRDICDIMGYSTTDSVKTAKNKCMRRLKQIFHHQTEAVPTPEL